MKKSRTRIIQFLIVFFTFCLFYKLGKRLAPQVGNGLKYLKITIGFYWIYSIMISIGSLIFVFMCYWIGRVADVKNDEKDKSFAEKHPRLNLLIGFGLVVFFLDSIIMLLTWIGNLLESFINWIGNIASELDAVIIVALITGIVSIASVVISKWLEYRRARNEYLAKKREEPYGEFISMIYKIQQTTRKPEFYTEEMMTNDILNFSKQITLWGSPGVVEKWDTFRENATNPQNAVNNLFLVEEIMNEMRKDLGLRKTKKGRLLSFFVNDIHNFIKKD